jgi:hypothetical protein
MRWIDMLSLEKRCTGVMVLEIARSLALDHDTMRGYIGFKQVWMSNSATAHHWVYNIAAANEFRSLRGVGFG